MGSINIEQKEGDLMKILHIADLHLGKTIYGVSMLENGDQKYWIDKFLSEVGRIKPDAVVIAGDVYDRSSPSGAAVQLLDYFLTELSKLDVSVFMIAGNHDSGQKLSFAGSFMAQHKIHVSGNLGKELVHCTLSDEYGEVTFWLLPYVFPALVSQVFNIDEGFSGDYDSAIRHILENQNIDTTQRNIMIAHQNVTASGNEVERGGSESMVGGVGQVDFTAFDSFDYVALGHIHSSYQVGRDSVRYSGTPMCYHFDETRQTDKGALLITLGPKGEAPIVERIPITPLNPMTQIRGTFDDVYDQLKNQGQVPGFVKVVLTDKGISPEISDMFHTLCKSHGSQLLEITSEYRQFFDSGLNPSGKQIQELPVEELFSSFYSQMKSGTCPDETEMKILSGAAELVRNTAPDEFDADTCAEKLLQEVNK